MPVPIHVLFLAEICENQGKEIKTVDSIFVWLLETIFED
jgi:hypothetical protein